MIGANIADGNQQLDEHRSMAQIVERLARMQDVTAALSQALTPEEVATVVVEQGIAASGAYAGCVNLLSEDRTQLTALRMRGDPAYVADTWHILPIRRSVPLTTAIVDGTPVYLASRAAWEQH